MDGGRRKSTLGKGFSMSMLELQFFFNDVQS